MFNRRAFADFAIDRHMSARLPRKAVYHTETEARASANILGAKERLEYVLDRIRRNAKSVIRG